MTKLNPVPAFRPASLLVSILLATLPHGGVRAQSTDPTTDPFPVLDNDDTSKSFVVRLRFQSRFDVALESASVIQQLAAGKAGEPPLLAIQLRDTSSNVLDEFYGWHPLWAFQRDTSGHEHRLILNNRVATIVAAYQPQVAQMVVRDVAAQDQVVATVDLMPASHTFCRANSGDPDCASIPNRAPTCSSGGTYNAACTGLTTNVMLNGAASSDADGDPLTLQWTGSFSPSPTTGVAPTVTFSGLGTFPITLNVADGRTSTSCNASAVVVDAVAPSIVAAATNVTRCTIAPAPVTLTASASDLCTAPGSVSLSGTLTQIAGKALSPTIALGASPVSTVLPSGSARVAWRAVDGSGNATTVNQDVTVSVQETAAACCPAGSTVVQGGAGIDVILRPLSNAYCVFANGAADTVVTGGGQDFVAGGAGDDVLDSGPSSGDTLTGGAGDDWLRVPLGTQTKVYGGDGADVISVHNSATVFGNAGDDYIDGDIGTHVIYPGPGRDTVHAGVGDDTVVIRNVCEVVAGELLDGGLGNDTLITPVPVADLIARGAVLLGFQTVIVKSDEQHLSECF
ncbi:MAG TPA: hypothetical protein VJV78_08070 [Polyangiales bacterium]|nr:hypothetical protein [Polyangiales bacterium]